jgi:hypothetical protein
MSTPTQHIIIYRYIEFKFTYISLFSSRNTEMAHSFNAAHPQIVSAWCLILLCLLRIEFAQGRAMSSTRVQKQADASHAQLRGQSPRAQPVLEQLRAIQKSIDELKASILSSPTNLKVIEGLYRKRPRRTPSAAFAATLCPVPAPTVFRNSSVEDDRCSLLSLRSKPPQSQ